MNYGFIYCLGNPAMPGIFKIGMTERAPSQRCQELSGSTSAPLPFDLLFYGEVENPSIVEREIHDELYIERINDSREFFRGTTSFMENVFRRHCDCYCTTTDGAYYLSIEDAYQKIASATCDAGRVEILRQHARHEGIVMWQEGGRIQFNVPDMHLVPRWVLMAAATSKSVLLQHLPHEFKPKPSLILASSNTEILA